VRALLQERSTTMRTGWPSAWSAGPARTAEQGSPQTSNASVGGLRTSSQDSDAMQPSWNALLGSTAGCSSVAVARLTSNVREMRFARKMAATAYALHAAGKALRAPRGTGPARGEPFAPLIPKIPASCRASASAFARRGRQGARGLVVRASSSVVWALLPMARRITARVFGRKSSRSAICAQTRAMSAHPGPLAWERMSTISGLTTARPFPLQARHASPAGM
jgi:hypothetical protein